MHILICGGAGYIGTHTCLLLLVQGYNVTVFDNLSNSNPISLQRVAELSGHTLQFTKGDLRDATCLSHLLSSSHYDAVIHFAGLKAVGESVCMPLEYYDNNITGTLNLLQAMRTSYIPHPSANLKWYF